MIPADLITRVRLSNDLSTQPTAPVQKLADALSDFVPGQRVMANIQALLPNGTYRAMIAQRQITLALPFAAKPGDALELEVVDSDGKLALAVATGRKNAEEAGADASVRTRLTQAGKLIGDLLAGLDREGGKRPQPSLLNQTQPLVSRFSNLAAELAPALKAAISSSGMFYEAHQARWVQGRLPTETLLQEPQGRLSPGLASPTQLPAPNTALQQANTPTPERPVTAPAPGAEQVVRVISGTSIAPELAPLVQQQLESLATQTYIWQGQAWPGQKMEWEIVEEEQAKTDSDPDASDEHIASNWTTRLRLTLPTLGYLELTLKLEGTTEVQVRVSSADDQTRERLNQGGLPLYKQFEALGLALQSFAVTPPATTPTTPSPPTP